jgi:hypothetical protein
LKDDNDQQANLVSPDPEIVTPEPEVASAEPEAIRPGFWKKLQTGLVMFAAIMVSAGQWNDTKELFTSIYEDTLANFTNRFQYAMINQINVGNSLSYIKELVGEPRVLKRSRLDNDVAYLYYIEEKFDLVLLAKDERVIGYSIVAKEPGFFPTIPFSEELGTMNLLAANPKINQYNFDSSNLIYFIESQELDKQKMFLTLARGYVEYGGRTKSDSMPDGYHGDILSLISNLDKAETFGDSPQDIQRAVDDIRQYIYPNYFAITELEPKFIADALLTRYEYRMFTQS